MRGRSISKNGTSAAEASVGVVLDPQQRRASSALLPSVVLSLAVCVALVRLLRFWSASQFGIDFTDEGYYLNWIADPFAYRDATTLFGFVYHPLYMWLGQDVAGLRQANILITFFLAWGMGVAFFRATLTDGWPAGYWRSWPMIAIAGICAISYPNVLDQWLPTPSYNSLALQAVLLIGAGMLMPDRDMAVPGYIGAILVGIGGWLAFMSKPTTAAAMAVVVLFYWTAAGRISWRSICVSTVTSILLLWASAVAIDGSISAFLARLEGGLKIGQLLGVQQPMSVLVRLDDFHLGTQSKRLAQVLVLLVVFCTVGAATARGVWASVREAVLLILVLISALLVMNLFTPAFGKDQFWGVIMLAIPVGALVSAAFLQHAHWAGGFSRNHLALAVAFMMVPHAFAFGTGNNYWQAGAGASLFWVFAGISILVAASRPSASWHVLLPAAAGVQLIAAVLMQVAIAQPYRQPQPLTRGGQLTALGPASSKLILNLGYSQYIRRLRDLSHEAGFAPGTPVLDMTGHSPGTLYGLGAKATGQPWILGGYAGSDRAAEFILGKVGCEELARTWLLVQPRGPRKLSPAILQRSGMDMESDFTLVGSLDTPPGFGGYAVGTQQQLLRPTRASSIAERECESARRRAP
ncbi:MAG: hypothetical protein ABI343_02080 [Burkholderiaceae bacterium]